MSNKKQTQKEIDSLKESMISKLTDKQLQAADRASANHHEKLDYNPRQRKAGKRKTKINQETAELIRKKYVPYIYGKKRLSDEFDLSVVSILKIIRLQIYKP